MEAKDFQKKVEDQIAHFDIKLKRIEDFVSNKRLMKRIIIGETT